MALQINATLNTPSGITVEAAYINIAEIYISKATSTVHIAVNTYYNADARTANKQPLNIVEFSSPFSFEYTLEELTSDNVYAVAYSKLKTALESVLGENTTANI